jgi:magnesium transporter
MCRGVADPEEAVMTSATASAAAHQPPEHGPLGNAVKWAFKTYIRTRQALDTAVAEAKSDARNNAHVSTEPRDRAPAATEARVNPRTPTRADLKATPAPVRVVSSARVAGGATGEPLHAIRTTTGERTRLCWLTPEGLEERPVGELRELLARDDGFVWLNIPTFDRPAEQMLTDVFKFHPLAIRDCREPGHVPKVHAYDDHLFIVLHAPVRTEDGQIGHRELNQFLGRTYLVTVHELLRPAESIGQRLETTSVLDRIKTGRARPATPAELSYAIVTRLSVHMERVVSDLASSVAALEQAVSSHERHLLRRSEDSESTVVDEMFELRHALLAIETIADQNRVVYARSSALADRILPREQHRFIDDVEDQFSQVRRLCRGQKELLQGVLDFARTHSTAKMDRAMSRLALLSAIALPISIISSIYGMNLWVFNQTHFELLALALGLMAVSTLAMVRWTRQEGWQW